MIGENNDGIVFMALNDILPSEISISYMKIYNEKIYDSKTKDELNIYNNLNQVINNLHVEHINTHEEAVEFYKLL